MHNTTIVVYVLNLAVIVEVEKEPVTVEAVVDMKVVERNVLTVVEIVVLVSAELMVAVPEEVIEAPLQEVVNAEHTAIVLQELQATVEILQGNAELIATVLKEMETQEVQLKLVAKEKAIFLVKNVQEKVFNTN